MKKYSFLNLLAFIILATMLSCNKTSNTEESVGKLKQELPTALTYLTALTTPVDVQFIIESSSSMLVNGNSQPTLNGTALDVNGERVNIGSFYINGLVANPINNVYGQGFIFPNNVYGERLVMKANPVSSPLASGYDFIDTLYVPNKLQISSTSINQEMSLNTIGTGKVINWMQDLNNLQGGMVIVVEYIPLDIANASIRQVYPNYVRNGIVVSDNGTYTFNNSLLKDMPRGAYLLVTLARINYKMGVTSGNKSYLVCSNNQKYLNFRFP